MKCFRGSSAFFFLVFEIIAKEPLKVELFSK